MRRKNVRLAVVLWVSGTAADVHETIRCQRGNSCWLLPCAAHHHTYIFMAFCLRRARRLFSSKSTMSRQFHFAQQRILSETQLLFPYPCPLNSKVISHHRHCVPRNCATHRRVASKEFVQPSKVALCGFALKVSTDISLSGSH